MNGEMSNELKAKFKEAFDEAIAGDECIRTWFEILITDEIKEMSGTIQNQKLASLGGDPYGEENLIRMKDYMLILMGIKDALSAG